MRYIFSDSDLSICSKFAESVNALKANYRTTNNLNDNPHYLGKLGELVFSKQFNLPVNFDVSHSGDSGYDFQLGNITIDVKATQYWKYPELKEFVRETGKQKPDVYVLVSINLDECWGYLCGFMSSRKLEKIEPIQYRNLGLRRVATIVDMCKDWELLNNYAHSDKYADMKSLRFNNSKSAIN